MGDLTSDSMAASMAYFSGGAYTPSSCSPVLHRLEQRLHRLGATCDEFLYYLISYYDPFTGPALFRQHNRLASDSVLEEFTKYLHTRQNNTRISVHSQMHMLKRYAELGVKLQLILDDPEESFSAIVRIESAIKHNLDLNATVAQWRDLSTLMLRGNPDYRTFCPGASALLKPRKGEA